MLYLVLGSWDEETSVLQFNVVGKKVTSNWQVTADLDFSNVSVIIS